MLNRLRFASLAACALAVFAQQGASPTPPAPEAGEQEVRVSAHVYAPQAVRITTQAQLVQLDAVVRDARGRAVAGLSKDDFEILDEGKPRAIVAFSAETRDRAAALASSNAPPPRPAAAGPEGPLRFVMLFFDDIHANTGEMRRVQNAALYFVKHNLTAGMRAAVYSSNDGLAADFTADTAKLAAAIEKLRAHPRISDNGLMPCPRITPYQAYAIYNNIDPSAVVAAVSEMAACTSTDPTLPNIYQNQGAGAGTTSKLAVNVQGANAGAELMFPMAVQQQATTTWEIVRAASMDSYDGIDNAIARLAPMPGSRVLLVVSEGFLCGPEEASRQQRLIDNALKSGVVINALDAKGLWAESPARPMNETSETITLPTQTFMFEASSAGAARSALNSTVSELASSTGGLFFHNGNDLAGGFDLLGAVPEVTYSMAFRPGPGEAAGKYHKLKVRLATAKQDYVQTRPGYFATPAVDEEAAQHKLDAAALASDTPADFALQLAGRVWNPENSDPILSLIIHVDLNKVEFEERDGRERQKLAFIAALINSKGEMAAAKQGVMDLALKEETLMRLAASGLNGVLALKAPPGPYRVRVVVEDAYGRMAALNQTVEMTK